MQFLGLILTISSCSFDSSDEYCNLRVANYSSLTATRVEVHTKYGNEKTNEQVVQFPELQAGEVSAYMPVKVKLGVKSFFDSRTKLEVTSATLSYTTDRNKAKVVAEDKFGNGYGVFSPNESYTIFIANNDP